MSRVAKQPVVIPANIEFSMDAEVIHLKSKNGTMSHSVHDLVEIVREGNTLTFRTKDSSNSANALAGTTRALVQNMVKGLEKGFERKLNLVGVGYRAQVTGTKLNLSLGFSHPVSFEIPAGIKIVTPTQTEVIVSGYDKQKVGQVAAKIRAYRPPEPYKGKGVRYSDEVIVLKETKKK